MVPLLLMFVVLYFIMIRPQMKRAKEHKAMVEAVQKGDEVIAAGGMLGRINKLDENYVSLQIAPNVEVQIQRGSIQLVLPKGTLKGIG
jgi:preprotein translocase subunit YajC